MSDSGRTLEGISIGKLFEAVEPESGVGWVYSPDELTEAFPDYQVFEVIGRGGMGAAVYRALHKRLRRMVALKILPPEASSGVGIARRFRQEAQALAELHHPYIVAVHDFGRTPQRHLFIAMEYLEDGTLAQRMAKSKLTLSETRRIFTDVSAALECAHDRGILHRDIKPDNILMDGECTKLADFGLAKRQDSSGAAASFTQSGAILGTYGYMAPEQLKQCENAAVDHRADVYGLGVLLHEMLTGELPCSGEAAKPSKSSAAPKALDHVVQKALSSDSASRYASVRAFREAVDHALREVPKQPNTKTFMAGALCLVAAVLAFLALFKSSEPPNDLPPSNGKGLTARYYMGVSFDELREARIDPDVNFDWETNPPATNLSSEGFSARWSGYIVPPFTGECTLFVTGDNDSGSEGWRLFLDNERALDRWDKGGAYEPGYVCQMEAGEWRSIAIEYFNARGTANLRLEWETAERPREIIPREQFRINELSYREDGINRYPRSFVDWPGSMEAFGAAILPTPVDGNGVRNVHVVLTNEEETVIPIEFIGDPLVNFLVPHERLPVEWRQPIEEREVRNLINQHPLAPVLRLVVKSANVWVPARALSWETGRVIALKNTGAADLDQEALWQFLSCIDTITGINAFLERQSLQLDPKRIPDFQSFAESIGLEALLRTDVHANDSITKEGLHAAMGAYQLLRAPNGLPHPALASQGPVRDDYKLEGVAFRSRAEIIGALVSELALFNALKIAPSPAQHPVYDPSRGFLNDWNRDVERVVRELLSDETSLQRNP